MDAEGQQGIVHLLFNEYCVFGKATHLKGSYAHLQSLDFAFGVN